MATQTPWGKSDGSQKIVRGVSFHSTSGHGGMLVSKGWAKKNLSESAQKLGEVYGGYLCYEEDIAYAIPCLELIRKFPELHPQVFPCSKYDLLQTQNVLIEKLSRWYPDYLIEVGFKPIQEHYDNWLNSKKSEELRAQKAPNLIVSAASITNNVVMVWTADDKKHMVSSSSYDCRKCPNLLSDCTVYDYTTAILAIQNDSQGTPLPKSSQQYVEEYGSQVVSSEVMQLAGE